MSLSPQHRVLCAGTCQATLLLDRFGPAREAGFTAVSVFTSDLEAAKAAGISRADIRLAAAEAKLAITDLEIVARWWPGQSGAPCLFPAELMATLERATAEPICRAAAELGAANVTLAELYATEFDGPAMAGGFGEVCDIAAGHGLTAALEFVPTGGVAGLAQAWEIVERADRSNGGLVVDLWHLTRSGGTAEALAAIPGERIFSIQLDDGPAAAETDLVMAMMNARRLPGEGAFDLAGLMAALAATGTTAPAGIEVFSEALNALPFAEAARRCAAGLEYCLALAEPRR